MNVRLASFFAVSLRLDSKQTHLRDFQAIYLSWIIFHQPKSWNIWKIWAIYGWKSTTIPPYPIYFLGVSYRDLVQEFSQNWRKKQCGNSQPWKCGKYPMVKLGGVNPSLSNYPDAEIWTPISSSLLRFRCDCNSDSTHLLVTPPTALKKQSPTNLPVLNIRRLRFLSTWWSYNGHGILSTNVEPCHLCNPSFQKGYSMAGADVSPLIQAISHCLRRTRVTS